MQSAALVANTVASARVAMEMKRIKKTGSVWSLPASLLRPRTPDSCMASYPGLTGYRIRLSEESDGAPTLGCLHGVPMRAGKLYVPAAINRADPATARAPVRRARALPRFARRQ